MTDDSTSEDLARYRELSANSAAAYARYAEMRAQDLERELRSGRFQYSSAGDEARSVVKEFLLYFFGAAVLLVPASLGVTFLLLTLIGVDISDISNVFAVIVWLGASIGFAYWGVGRH
jgi:hypothetical protein